ncbi:anthranilate phosphoribosyltransferase [Gallaecimonas sp. GXIMD4217]|uniref:anthranilate phosphoribosyltransferase n=1 Tax=Gallaecimonas sp. GXIMD4217 TaxID=3131927 RepID=UPI00311ADC20
MNLDHFLTAAPLSQDQARALFTQVVQGELEPVQLAAVLTAMKVRGETADEVSGAALALLDAALPFPTPDYRVLDCCGTGGDGANTLNISTSAAFVAAAAGVKVVKHGNRAVSSQSGSTDVLGALGLPVEVAPELARRALDELNLCFLAAPQYHPGIRHAMAVRKSLKTRTLFNLVGPLVNPARPGRQLMGVYHESLLPLVADTLMQLGRDRALVVHGSGLDELALHGPTRIIEIKDGKQIEHELTPQRLGLEEQALAAIRGGDANHNACRLKNLLEGREYGAYVDAVALNAAALLYLDEKAATLVEGLAAAREVIDSGKAGQLLKALKELLHG